MYIGLRVRGRMYSVIANSHMGIPTHLKPTIMIKKIGVQLNCDLKKN